jgi:hypothetical protein
MDDLKKQAEELGIKVDGRWSAEKLQEKIDERLAEEPAPAPEPVEEPDEEVPVVVEEPDVPEVVAPEDPVRDPEPPESDADSDVWGAILVTSLIENPMKVFGLTGKGSTAIFTRSQLAADKRLVAKLERAEAAGMVSVEEA